jgi:hypothetical protein
MWEKGKAIVQFLPPLKTELNYSELKKQTGRSDTSLKQWHDLYFKNPDRSSPVGRLHISTMVLFITTCRENRLPV